MLSTALPIRMTDPTTQSDEHLFRSFVEARNEDAFAEIVRRHGAMVLGVCRRVAKSIHDAEDAFQATFLVLARKAESISPATLAPWLYGVAYRTALKARIVASRRRLKEHSMVDVPETWQTPKEVDRELTQQLDSALLRLPAKYRAAIVLCELQQLPRRRAAALLQIPEGTLSSRLAAGRKMLAAHLNKRGLTPSVGALGVALSILSRSAPAEPLVVSTVEAAAIYRASGAVSLATTSCGAATLAQGVLKMMLIKKVAIGMLVLLTGTSAVVGVAVYGGRASEQEGSSVANADKQPEVIHSTGKLDALNAKFNANQAREKSTKIVKAEKKEDQKKREAKPDPRQAVQKALQGVWAIESLEDHAKLVYPNGFVVVFDQDRFTFKLPPEQPFSGRYEVDPKRGPQIINFIAKEDGKPRLAIFDLNGDELRICMNEDPNGERPDRFVSEKAGKNDLLMVLKRKAATESK
jgi:RNA polymerase sigma factor (sigma-70 family)